MSDVPTLALPAAAVRPGWIRIAPRVRLSRGETRREPAAVEVAQEIARITAKTVVSSVDSVENLNGELERPQAKSSPPIHRIPAEILSMIFASATEGGEDLFHQDFRDLSVRATWGGEGLRAVEHRLLILRTLETHKHTHHAKHLRRMPELINITLVCKAWRDVVETDAYLWGQLETAPLLGTRELKVLQRWFARAKRSPKALRLSYCYPLRCDCAKTGDCFYSNPNLLKLLVDEDHIARLHLLKLTPRCFTEFIKSVKHANGGSTPLWWDTLHTLELDFHQTYPVDTYWALPDARTLFHALPPVTSLTLNTLVAIPWEPTRQRLDIGQSILTGLTRLTLRYNFDGPQLVMLLRHCTNVEDLALALQIDHWQNPAMSDPLDDAPLLPPTTVTYFLPKVTSLTLEFCYVPGIRIPFRYLRFPGLVNLHVARNPLLKVRTWQKDKNAYSQVLEWLKLFSHSRAPSSLRSLRLGSDGIHCIDPLVAEDLYYILSHLQPQITHLSLNGEFDAHKFMQIDEEKRASGKGRKLCPSLQSLELLQLNTVDRYLGDFDLEPFLVYIKNRHNYQKGEDDGVITLVEPFDGLKRVVVEVYTQAKSKSWMPLQGSETLETIRSFGVVVDRLGYSSDEETGADGEDSDGEDSDGEDSDGEDSDGEDSDGEDSESK
ncbi:hypothetical protein DFP72DRAFT_923109 [Ephemerocybe angulata]|uniref:F-box domain-containing protein n=1 Tax=Ephemerocybe angulata TaxID=980116 RepID=A0A8H6HGB0_9AGAR|nr:hypothetical protein DFP72DRAFT_923109 [Tulosesus angulatus]